MRVNQAINKYYFWHSVRLLIRYQQIYVYPLLGIMITLLPKLFGISEKYFLYLYSFDLIVVLWVYSPFYLGQFSFSPEDARSITLFSIKAKDLVYIRNLLNFVMLTVTLLLLLLLIFIVFPIEDKIFVGLVLLYGSSMLPALIVGNLLTDSTLTWSGRFAFSWKSTFVIILVSINDLVIKTSYLFLSPTSMFFVLFTLFIIYLLTYILSYNKVVKELTSCFSSIAEN